MSGREVTPIEEISVSAELTDSGLKAGAKSRALAAIDRLLGSTIDLIGVPIEGLRDRMRARNDHREDLIRATGRLMLEQVGKDSTLDSHVIEGQLLDVARKAANKEAVAVAFLEELKSEPGLDDDRADPIDADWMNMFSAHAENASSDHLRTLWARILAGQVRAPGAFSLSTLRFVSELDKSIAELFQRHVGSIIGDQFIIKPKELKGNLLIDLTFLEEVGLLIEVNGMLGVDQENGADGYKYHIQGNRLLKIKLLKKTRLDLIKLTRIGKEIASILPRPSDEQALIDVYNYLKEDVIEAELHSIADRKADGSASLRLVRKLK